MDFNWNFQLCPIKEEGRNPNLNGQEDRLFWLGLPLVFIFTLRPCFADSIWEWQLISKDDAAVALPPGMHDLMECPLQSIWSGPV